MYLGLKNTSGVSNTVTTVSIKDTNEVVTNIFTNTNNNGVLANNATLNLGNINAQFASIFIMPIVKAIANGFTLVARASTTDSWIEVIPTNEILDTAGNNGVRLVVSNTEVDDALASLSVAEIAVINALTTAQQAVINSLTLPQQITFVRGGSADKAALMATLTPQQQALFTSIPVQFIQTLEQIAADKIRLEDVVFRFKSGEFISDDDSVFYTLGNSLMAIAAMTEIDEGRGYNGLRNIGLTQAQALKVLSIYNVVLETTKYESEIKLAALESAPASIGSLETYLAGLTPPLVLPPITQYLAALRADTAIYTAIRNWTP